MIERLTDIGVSLAAVGAMAAIGAAILRLADPRGRIGPPLRWGLFLPTGSAATSGYLFLLSWGQVPATRWIVLPPTLVAVAVLLATRPKSRRSLRGEPFRRIDWLLAGLMAAIVLTWLQRTMTFPMHAWDALATWGYKAQVIYHETVGGTDYFQSGPERSHLPYPLLVPLTMVWIAAYMGRFDDVYVQAVFPALAGSLGLILFAGLRRCLQRTAALAMALSLMVTHVFGWRAIFAEADMAFAALAIATVVLLVEYLGTDEARFLILAAVTVAGAAFAKNEGLALLAVTSAAMLFGRLSPSARTKSCLATTLCYLAVALTLLSPWLVFRAQVAQTDERYLEHLTPANLFAHVGRIPVILARLAVFALDVRLWWLLWPILAIGLGCLIAHKRQSRQECSGSERPAGFVLLVAAGQMAVYVLVYVITPNPLEFQLSVTAERLLLHVLPMLCLAAGMGLADSKLLMRPEVRAEGNP